MNNHATETFEVVGIHPTFLTAVNLAKRAARSSANILLNGESGTGKEIFAKLIHSRSKNRNGPFVAINCSAIPENLLESELFGHSKGSFTGASEKRIGLFEEAENGTLFLDEIGDLNITMQAKLLRVLQERKIKRVGENTFRQINCRIISATHRNLPNEIQAEKFREDLFYRLNVISITVPPLRERGEDKLILANAFLKKYVLLNNSAEKSLSPSASAYLMENSWRGNVRELENTIERAVVLSRGSEISMDDFATDPASEPQPRPFETNDSSDLETSNEENTFCVSYSDRLPKLDDILRKYIEFAVTMNHGARDKTAKEIGIDRKTLYKRLRPEQQ